MKEAYTQVQIPRRFIFLCVIGIILSLLYPTDLQSYRTSREQGDSSFVLVIEKDIRFINTIVQVGFPLFLKDKIGLVQLVNIAISTTAATHGLKRLLNKRTVWGTRLGERPSGPFSQHNMPSGHSSMASSAVYFVGRRYGFIHGLYLIPILFLTMYARVALNAHTVAAVIAGALLGLLMAAIWTSKRKA